MAITCWVNDRIFCSWWAIIRPTWRNMMGGFDSCNGIMVLILPIARLYVEHRWASVGFPYLHGAWHILIFLASYTAIVLFAYFEVKNNYRTETPVLMWVFLKHWNNPCRISNTRSLQYNQPSATNDISPDIQIQVFCTGIIHLTSSTLESHTSSWSVTLANQRESLATTRWPLRGTTMRRWTSMWSHIIHRPKLSKMQNVELDFLFCTQLYSYQDAVFDFLLAVLITKRSKNLIVKIRPCYQFEL